MKYHCGILNVRPEESWTLNRFRVKHWPYLPEQHRRQLHILLATPGFTTLYFCHVFQRSFLAVSRYRAQYARFEDYEEEAVENWMSVTREDAIRLSLMRPPRGDMPLVSQIRALEDLKFMSQTDVAKLYGIGRSKLFRLTRKGPICRQPLPSGFEWLVAKRYPGHRYNDPNSVRI